MLPERMIAAAFSALLFLAVFCGCRSDVYYQNRAVEDARKFLLAEAKELDFDQQEYIRYNDPVILHNRILGEMVHGKQDQLSNELRQICVTWQLPGQDGVYMVYGVSTGKMMDWKPERVLRRTFVKPVAPLKSAAAQAVQYAINNLSKDLSVRELNIIRFTAPALCVTNFDVAVKLPDDPEKHAAFAENHGKKLQLTLVWKVSALSAVYFCGFGMPDMSQWNIERAGIIPYQDMESRITRTVLSPEQFNSQLPDLSTGSPIGVCSNCSDAASASKDGACKHPANGK